MASQDFSRIFSSLLSSLRSQRQREKTVNNIDENILIGLYSLFGETLKSALDILDRKKVTVYEGETSGRRCAVVLGNSGSRHLVLVSGQHCTCPSYQYSAIRESSQIHCKHILALRLGLALGWVETSRVEDCHVNTILQDLA